MAKPPLILITPSIEKSGVEFHDLSASLSIKYENAVLQSGGLPVTAPTTNERALLAEVVRHVDGVLLTGGDDINPDLYAQRLPQTIRKTVEQTPDGGGRDLRELILIDEIFRQHKPLLAICRGHQLLNIALGGKLIVDIRQQVSGALNHQRLDKAGEIVHEAALTADSLLAKIVGKKILGVNSSHHQAVLQPAEPLMATARSRDGIVEAMELKPAVSRMLPFLLSVQFHPERLAEHHAVHRAISGGSSKPAFGNPKHESQSSHRGRRGGFARVAHLRAGGLLRHRPGRHGGATGKTFSAARARRRSARRETARRARP